MSPIVRSLPPHLVQLCYDYVLAVATGDNATTARLTPEVELLPGLQPAITELIVFAVTALPQDTEPCANPIRQWATHAPTAATPGIARTTTHYVGQILADAPTDVIRTLQELRDEQVERARAMVPAVVALPR
ncbi:hypothetical protein ACIQPS_32970 [Streptomyces sp. NPDC091290]|uniref:hypothetical protein n=1 Tax=Streptomyces sp. NPDC091290 TaxID=3365990 RepID=UPI0038274E3A